MDKEKLLKKTQVILKFHYGKRGSINPIISKTMGRVAVISHAYQGPMPQPGTFWLCELDQEINSGSSERGCFVVMPVKSVPLEKIMKLIPGMYETEIQGQNVFFKPKEPNHYWIVPFNIKKVFLKDKTKVQYQSVIVPLVFDQQDNK
jgi:hypothetical protein